MDRNAGQLTQSQIQNCLRLVKINLQLRNQFLGGLWRRFDDLNDQVDMIFQVARIATFMIAGAGLAGVAVAPPVAIAAGGFVAVLGLIKLGFKVHSYMQETTTCHLEPHHPDPALSKA